MSDQMRGPPFRLIPFLCPAILAISALAAEIKQATEENDFSLFDFDTDSVVNNIDLQPLLPQRGTKKGETTCSLMVDLNFSDQIDYEDIILFTCGWRSGCGSLLANHWSSSGFLRQDALKNFGGRET